MRVPTYSARAAKAMGALKRANNDVEVYVEDTGNRNMWVFLVKRLLPPHTKLKSVNGLGGRREVIEACKLDQDAEDPRKRIYVIDADFDYIIGKRAPNLLNLCRLDCYCVENTFCNERTIVDAGLRMQPKLSEKELRKNFQFKEWFNAECAKMKPLFMLYATARIADDSIQTVGFPVKNLYLNTDMGPVACPSKTRGRFFSLARKLILLKGSVWLREQYMQISLRCKGMNYNRLISGKDYIFPLLHLRLKRVFGYKGDIEQLKVDLASSWMPLKQNKIYRCFDAVCTPL